MPLRAPKGFIDETDPKVCQIGHPAPPWLVNYADLMTELVCFFVILYALSAALNKNVGNAKDQIDQMIAKKEIKAETKVDKEGLHVTLEEQGAASFFESGSADTTQAIDDALAKVAPVLKKLAADHDIIVEGHTDNQGISNEYYDSNWELSTSRATSIARLLIDKYGFPPNHIGAVGYGEFRPIASNDTPEGRSKNRRVVFFVKNAPIGNEIKTAMAGGATPEKLEAPVPQSPPPAQTGTPPPSDAVIQLNQ